MMPGVLFGHEDSNRILTIESTFSLELTISWAFGASYVTGSNGLGNTKINACLKHVFIHIFCFVISNTHVGKRIGNLYYFT